MADTSPSPAAETAAPAAPDDALPGSLDDLPLAEDEAVPPNLGERLPQGGTRDPDEILDLFLSWVADQGLELYEAQEEAILEIMAGRHVILSTPTGSGKSLVALALHFKGLCEGRRSYYTSPIKALASEKFFQLCRALGPEHVGMTTGDASINSDALVVCCTAEVLANMALRRGREIDAPYVVMDEFHYYADRDRGSAWQIPLITLPETRFLLMSATLGDTTAIETHLAEQTVHETSVVASDERPVPLDFEYRETPLHETIDELLEDGRAPIYIVNFTQRECAELAQSLTSANVASREERDRIQEAMAGVRLDTPYGKEFRRFLSFGIGVHHAGLLPKYRLLVEQLAQAGLLKVIAGTDTLGVGVNIPIRTVLFTRLSKYDGRKVGLLAVRDFQQIAGRAGRKGFDDEGSVVAQAPEHIIEKRQLERKADGAKQLRKMLAKRKGPAKGEVGWTEETFDRLRSSPPETLQSRFRITHGMILDLIQRDAEVDDPERRNFDSLRRLIERSHEDDGTKTRLLSRSAQLIFSLYRAGVLRMVRDTESDYRWVVLDEDLQLGFSLHQALSLYLVETIGQLDRESETYALDLLTLVEAILENPEIVLRKQRDKAKGELVDRLKADGVPYEERMERLEEVTHPQPLKDFIYGSFHHFALEHPWVGGQDISPKSIGREMFEGYFSFADYVKRYGLQRSEGVLLRYLSQLYKTLLQSVPDGDKTEEVWDLIGFFRTILERTDTSLLEEWESLLHPELRLERPDEAHQATEALWLLQLVEDPKALAARVRTELQLLVKALSERDWEEAAATIESDPEDPEGPWEAERFEAALEPFFAEYERIVFTPEARRHRYTQIRPVGPREWQVSQTILDPEGDELWAALGRVDLRQTRAIDGPIVTLERIGP